MSLYNKENPFFHEPPYQTCGLCEQPAAVFQCPGCFEPLCSKHTEQHRQPMRKELADITEGYRQLKEKKQDTRKVEDECSQLLKQIEIWEDQSIIKIKQATMEAREQVNQLFHEHVTNKPSVMTEENYHKYMARLVQAQKKDDFHETHLAVWKHNLEDLQNYSNALSSKTFNARIHFSWEPFISKIIIRDGSWVGGSPWPFNDTQPSTIKPSDSPGELQSGTYRFRFSTQDVFLGIMSENVNKKSEPWNTPTVNGWGGNNIVCVDGKPRQGYQGYQSRLQSCDILALTVQRGQQTIRMTNERTRDTYELRVNINSCPFPWKLNTRCLRMIEN